MDCRRRDPCAINCSIPKRICVSGVLAQYAVLRFANQHGWLGLDAGEERPTYVVDPRDPGRKQQLGQLVRAEGLAEWADAIFAVRQAMDLLEAAEEKNEKSLRRWLTTVEDEWALYWRSEGGSSRAVARKMARSWKEEGFEFDAEEFIRSHPKAALTFRLDRRVRIDSTTAIAPYVRKGDRTAAARFVAQRLINEGLDPNTRARLLYDPESKRFNRHVVPRNLLGAIWIQTAAMAEGGRDYRRCEQCRGWFVLAPEINRSDRSYCSDRCRHKAYRDRRQRARELHAKGMTPARIARELTSDTQTVRGWLDVQR